MARTVPLKLNYASRSGLVKGPQYTIQEDPPWLQTQPQSSSAASPPAEPRPSSSYSADIGEITAMAAEIASPTLPPSNATKSSSSTDAPSPRPDIVAEPAQPPRPSRMPIFKQVRSMLTSSRSPTGPGAMKWDEYSGEPSENGKERLGVKPSTYKSPYEGILKPRRQSPVTSEQESPRSAVSPQFSPFGAHDQPASPVLLQAHPASPVVMPEQASSPVVHHEQLSSHLEHPTAQDARRLSPAGLSDQHARAVSPVSALVEDDMHMLEQRDSAISPPNSRPVSPLLTYDQLHPAQYEPSVTQERPRTEGTSSARVKRKPIGSASSQNDPFVSPTEVRVIPNSSHGQTAQSEEQNSRFSWTTAAQSEARHSIETRPPKTADDTSRPSNSHFSWSTVASGPQMMASAMREQTPPPSPPPVPPQYLEPPTYGTPPTQSILSRHRPFKKVEKPEWAPPAQPHTFTPRALSPKVYRIQNDYEVSTTPTAEGKKRLPLPPLFTEKSLSHLEGLLTREKNIVMQRRNIERSITDLEKVEKASPLEVSFADVREAKKKLEQRRGVLDEVRKEEMDIGIRIARARRKEDFGDGEGTLWVRRVTG